MGTDNVQEILGEVTARLQADTVVGSKSVVEAADSLLSDTGWSFRDLARALLINQANRLRHEAGLKEQLP